MREAVKAGRRLRAHLWNESEERVGFWCVVSLHPVHVNGSDGARMLKYFVGLQLRLTHQQMRQMSNHSLTLAQEATRLKGPSHDAPPLPPSRWEGATPSSRPRDVSSAGGLTKE